MNDLTEGKIVWIDLEPAKGHEQKNHGGRGRPCVVVQAGHPKLNLFIVVPLTDAKGKEGVSAFVPIKDLKAAGLTKPTVIDTYQIRALSKDRILKVAGSVAVEELDLVLSRIALNLGIEEKHL